jgi:hypothetical protein
VEGPASSASHASPSILSTAASSFKSECTVRVAPLNLRRCTARFLTGGSLRTSTRPTLNGRKTIGGLNYVLLKRSGVLLPTQ